jgi:hypothetical protein
MKKIIFKIYLLFVVSTMTFCTDNASLGEDYYYLPIYEAKDVGYPGGATIYKSPQKNVFRDIKIQGDIINVNYDKDFIIAIRENKDSLIIEKQGLNMDKFFQYFIIEKKSDKVFGPFNKEEYLQKRSELNVPEELELKEK